MTIPLFSGDASRSLLMQRRELQYSVGVSLRDHANESTLIAKNLQPALDEVFHARS